MGIVNFISSLFALPEDQVRLVLGLVYCFIFGGMFRTFLSPLKVSVRTRHVTSILFGCFVAYFVFSGALSILVIYSALSYTLMLLTPRRYISICIFIVSAILLSAIHISKMVINDEYMFDVTFSLMVMVQRITSLACNLRDGYKVKEKKRKDEIVDESLLKTSLMEVPSVLQYLSYVFYFQAIITGPFCFYKPYILFMEGKADNTHNESYKITNELLRNPLGLYSVVTRKMAISIGSLFVFFFVAEKMPVEFLIDDEFYHYPLFYRVLYYHICVISQRSKFYFTWYFAEAASHFSGLGFKGIDGAGKADWTGIDNIDIAGIELGLSWRDVISKWNMQTAVWLRYVVYDRLPQRCRRSSFGAFIVNFVSALWHGFYPGYYVVFITVSIFIAAGRKWRRWIRPHVVKKSKNIQLCYDIFTWICTQLSISYAILPFLFLYFKPAMIHFRAWNFVPNILAICLALLPNPS